MATEGILTKFEDLSYFDNLALWYLANETPPGTLALAFLLGNEKVCGSLLGVLDVKRRKFVHELMSQEENAPLEKKISARDGLLIIAEGLLERNLIEKKGLYFYGVKK